MDGWGWDSIAIATEGGQQIDELAQSALWFELNQVWRGGGKIFTLVQQWVGGWVIPLALY